MRTVEPAVLSPTIVKAEPATWLGDYAPQDLYDIRAVSLADRWVWRVELRDRVELRAIEDGAPRAARRRLGCASLALGRYAGERSTRRCDSADATPDIESRASGPVWRAQFDDPQRTALYFAADDGHFIAAATASWRVYDFFWMLHTMDYAGRDNFNNPLIITIGMAALWLSISGMRAADAELPMISRRRFVHGFAGAALVLGAARWNATRGAEMRPGAVLSGTQFDLTIGELPVNFTGARRTAIAINGQVPGPTLRWREGDTVTIRVTNRLRTTTAFHWHGLIVPADMDGVPGLSFDGIAPGETFTYRFKVNQSRHVLVSRALALSGTDRASTARSSSSRATASATPREREHVVLLSDWTDLDPGARSIATLKKQSDYFNFGQRTAGDFVARRALARAGRHARRAPHVGRDAHESDRPHRRLRLRLHLSDERRRRRPATGRRCSRAASACGCASSTARP